MGSKDSASERLLLALVSTDLRTHLDAIRDFLALCFATPPAQAVFQRL